MWEFILFSPHDPGDSGAEMGYQVPHDWLQTFFGDSSEPRPERSDSISSLSVAFHGLHFASCPVFHDPVTQGHMGGLGSASVC